MISISQCYSIWIYVWVACRPLSQSSQCLCLWRVNSGGQSRMDVDNNLICLLIGKHKTFSTEYVSNASYLWHSTKKITTKLRVMILPTQRSMKRNEVRLHRKWRLLCSLRRRRAVLALSPAFSSDWKISLRVSQFQRKIRDASRETQRDTQHAGSTEIFALLAVYRNTCTFFFLP